MANHPNAWSKKEIDFLKYSWKIGRKDQFIAMKLGRTVLSIRGKRKELGLINYHPKPAVKVDVTEREGRYRIPKLGERRR